MYLAALVGTTMIETSSNKKIAQRDQQIAQQHNKNIMMLGAGAGVSCSSMSGLIIVLIMVVLIVSMKK